MLTYIGNFTNFTEDRLLPNKRIAKDILEELTDFIIGKNVRVVKVNQEYSTGLGFTFGTVEDTDETEPKKHNEKDKAVDAKKITDKFDNIDLSENTSILLLNDFHFQLYDFFSDLIPHKNITMVFGAFKKSENKKQRIEEETGFCSTFSFMRTFAIRNFKEFADDPSTIKTLKEVIEMCKKFDVVIMNPPYGLGNEITASVINGKVLKEGGKCINLMPISKYKKSDLFRYVESIEKAEDTFEDATIGDCLAIAELTDHPCGKYNSWDDFTLVTYDETFRKFYEENRKKKVNSSVIVGAINTTKLPRPIDETTFYTMCRAIANGVDMSGYPYEFNNGRMSCEELTKKICKIKDNNPIVWGQCLWFESIEAKKNFTDFYYKNGKNGLMHKLIKGLNKPSGSIADAIPNVDWTHPWTDEELLADYGYTEEEIKNILG